MNLSLFAQAVPVASDPALDFLTEAARNGDLIAVSVACVVVLVPLILKALGKNVPFVDSLLSVAVGAFRSFRGIKKPPVRPPEEQGGIASVVPIKREGEK